MTTPQPRTPQEFIAHASRLVRAGRNRELLAYADQYAERFLSRFTAEELSRLDGMFEGAQMIVDLEEWEARRGQRAAATAAARPEAAERSVPATGR